MNEGSVFITGGAGFIGRWVVARCVQEGKRVTVYDNLCAGRRENIAAFQDRITFVEGDVTDAAALRAAMEQAAPQTLFHLAAHHFIPFCNAHPTDTLRVNVEGTYAALQAAADCGTQNAVIASSGVLYPGREVPLSEDEPPVIADVYGLSKRMTEEICALFATTTPLRCTVARLFNTYGPYETNPHVIPHIMQSLHEGPCVRLGNIHPKRDYIFVEDTAALLVRCAEVQEKYAVVNVGTGQEYSVAEIIEELSSLMGVPIQAVVDPARVRPVDKPHQIADTSRLERLTGARAAHSLRDGLKKLLEHEGLLPRATI